MLIERCTMHLHRRASLSSRFKAIDECHLFITQLPGQQIYWPHWTLSRTCVSLGRAYNCMATWIAVL